MDPFDLVRSWFLAFDRADLKALSRLYAPDAEVDLDGERLGGVDAVCERLGRHFAEHAVVHENGERRRVRTIARIETGVMHAEWISRERHRGTSEIVERRGYDHFDIDAGLIRHQREVTRAVEPAETVVARASPRRYPERPVVGVGGVIVEGGRVVLIKRRFEPLAGQWSLPGGTLELGETLEAGLAREMREETGLEVEVGPVVEVFDRILMDTDARVRFHFVLVDYLCRPVAGTLRAGSDVADAVYAGPDEFDRYRMTPKAVAVIERALTMAAVWPLRQTSG